MERFLYLLIQPYGFHALSRQEFETGLNKSVDTELPHGGDAPVQAAMRGQAIVASQPNSPVARAIDELARGLAGAPARARGARDAGASAGRRPGRPLDFLRRR